MNVTDYERFRAWLREFLRRARKTADSLETQVRAPIAQDNLSDVPMHLGDIGTEEYAMQLNATLFEHEKQILAEVIDALKRIDHGTFGRCDNCGLEIPEGRLEAVPYTRYCVRCAEVLGAEQPANLNKGRSQSRSDIIVPPDTQMAPWTDDSALHLERIPAVDLEPPIEGHPDVHAAGTPGGGTAVGGLAGTNIGHGAPDGAGLEDALGTGAFDVALEHEDPEIYGGPSGGAVGGTPANKRAVGGWVRRGLAPRPDPGDSPTGP